VFTNEAYRDSLDGEDKDDMVMIVDDIAMVTREPLDALKQVVTQTWSYMGGFCVPTDTTTNPNTVPTSSNSAQKRGIIIESL
jgi:hypothetical protein